MPVQVIPVPSLVAPVSSRCNQASITVALPGTEKPSLTDFVCPETELGPAQVEIAADAVLVKKSTTNRTDNIGRLPMDMLAPDPTGPRKRINPWTASQLLFKPQS